MKRFQERSQAPRMGRRKGATMVEFSLVFLLLLMMVAGVFEVGRIVWTYNTLNHAAKQASRYAMVHGSRNPITGPLTVETYAKQQAVGFDPQSLTVTVVPTPNNDPGSVVTVTVSHTMNTVVAPLVGLGKSITLSAKSEKTIVN